MAQTVQNAVPAQGGAARVPDAAPGSAPGAAPGAAPVAARRAAAGFALAHVALIPVGLALQGGARFDEGVEGIRRSYVEADLGTVVAGFMLEGLGFVLLVPALVFLALQVGRGTPVGRWAGGTALLCGLAYVTVTMAVGFPAGAVAAYGAQNGLDLDVAFALNNLRVFAYFLSLMLLGAHAIGLGVAALAGRELGAWVGWGGVLTGTVLLVSVPAAVVGLQDWGTLVWLVWWVGVAVALLRSRPGGRR